jgi:hypothetical protein
MLTVTIGTITRTSVVVETSAPAAYDGVGTLALHKDTPLNGGRSVAVVREHLAWQTSRDGSGLQAVTVHDESTWDVTAAVVLGSAHGRGGLTMPDITLFEHDPVRLTWGDTAHVCRVHASDERCGTCGGPTGRLDPPWGGWRLLCCQERALTTTQAELKAGLRGNPVAAIGLVSQVPVRLERLPREA